MTIKRKLLRCPRFRDVPGTRGREQQCKITVERRPFRVVRYTKTGNLVVWLLPKGKPRYKGMELPVSTPTTRSLSDLKAGILRFMQRLPARA